MKQLLSLYTLILLLTSCQGDEILEVPVKSEDYAPLNYMNFSLESNQSPSDEDAIHDLTLLFFDSYTSNRMYMYQLTDLAESSKLVEVQPGQYDIYFLANTAKLSLPWAEINTRADLHNLSLEYTSSTKNGILMTDSMQQVDIQGGGTQVKPISLQECTNGDMVRLVRSVSKIDIQLQIEELESGLEHALSKISSIKLSNIPKYIHPFSSSHEIMERKTIDVSLPNFKEAKGYIRQVVNIASTLNNKPVHWTNNQNEIPTLLLSLKDGQEIQIPLVSNYLKSWGIRYLDFALAKIKSPDGQRASYELKKNTHYIYQVKFNKNQLELNLEIMPWTVHEIINDEHTLPRYVVPEIQLPKKDLIDGYIIELDQNELSSPITFWLKSPKSARWRATLTNGLNFQLVGTSKGLADSNLATGSHTLSVSSRIIAGGQAVSTELFFTVNGQEIPLRVSFEDGTSATFGKQQRLTFRLKN